MKEKLELLGFVIQTNDKLNLETFDRYANLPNEYLTFLINLEHCATEDEKSWFNTTGDFNATNDSGFRWNEFEMMALEDYEDVKQIVAFWDNHIPILMSCRNFYCYFAISLLSDKYGQIVYGSEPEFEEPEFVANDFSEFMTILTNKTLDQKYLDQII